MSWDLCLARRAAAVGGVASVLALVVIAATDAGGPWSLRFGMAAALAPIAGAMGTFAAIRRAADKGELAALAAIGANPSRVMRGAGIGGGAIGAVGVVVAASPLADLASLFPRPTTARWVIDGDGARELTSGLHVLHGGGLAIDPPSTAALASPPVGFTLVTIALAAIACPAWASAPPASIARRATVAVVALAAAIVAFQSVAGDHTPAVVLVAAPAVLLADAIVARLGSRGIG